MARLPRESRELVERYFGRGPEGRPDRDALAAGLGLAAEALRIRAHRVRRLLEAAVNECTRLEPPDLARRERTTP
jgi:hypothetical protein